MIKLKEKSNKILIRDISLVNKEFYYKVIGGEKDGIKYKGIKKEF